MKKILLIAAVVFATSAVPLQAQSLLDLSKAPLFLNGTADPNVMVTFDDSGSMSFGFTPETADDATCAWRYNRFYSSSFNVQYYNPNIVYEPPLKEDGSEYPEQSYTAAALNGFDSAAGSVDLGTGYFVSHRDGNNIIFHPDRINPVADCQRAYRFPTLSAKAFYCSLNAGQAVGSSNNAHYTCKEPDNAEKTNFANWFSYYRLRGHALKTATARAFALLGDDMRIGWQNMNKNGLASTSIVQTFAGTARVNFFNWLYTSPYSGNTPTLESVRRVGEFFKRSGSATTNPYWDAASSKELSCRQNFHVLVTDGYWNQTGSYPSTSPAKGATQTAINLPDGKKFALEPRTRYIHNEAARGVQCLDDTIICDPAFADLAFYYWANDLRSTLTNNVPPYFPVRDSAELDQGEDPREVADLYWNPKNDPASWQHLVQYFIGFGIAGDLPVTQATIDAINAGTKKWPSIKNLDPSTVDDSWRGALASRGAYFGASNPNDIVDALTNILTNITERKGTSSAVSVSTGIVRTGDFAFQTQFDSSDWSGSVLARPVDAETLTIKNEIAWDAGVCLTTGTTKCPLKNWDTQRVVLTSTTTNGSGAAFRWGNLSSAQKTILNDRPDTVAVDSDGKGASRVSYIRGDRSGERANGGSFRNRKSLFGAVISSSAVVIGAPNATEYDDSLWPAGAPEAKADWSDFVAAHKSRQRMVVVGANDGMLHVINEKDGSELMAYVPHRVYRGLNRMTNPLYQFEPTVDSTVAVRNVFTNGAWRTLMVGTLRRGGQSLFAIDVTNGSFKEADAASIVRWEYSDASAGGADLGYTYGVPFLTRLESGDWVALVPGGYNSSEADGVAGTGNAVLLVLNLETGALIKKFDLGAIDANARGLAAPVAIDVNNDDISEMAYAGDLAGNVWRFSLTGNSSTWKASKLFTPSVAFNRPITSQPRVDRHPETQQLMVFVGTGKFIEVSDRTTNAPVQAFYGLIEDGATLVESNLIQRKMVTSGNTRSIGAVSNASAKFGWMILFDEAANKGERVIAPAALNSVGKNVVFATYLPSGDDPCTPGGSSFLMFASYASGGASPEGYAYFDSDGDGSFEDENANVVGTRITGLVPGVASILPEGGGVGSILLPPGDSDSAPKGVKYRAIEWRRHSWRDRTDLQGD